MSFETPQNLEDGQDTQLTSPELGDLHFDFLRAASKRGTTQIASGLPNPAGDYPRHYNVDLSRAPQDELKQILHIETSPINLRIDVTEPHVIDPQQPALVESTLISWTTLEDDDSLVGHSFFVCRDFDRSTEWEGKYESDDGLEVPRPITREEFSRLQTLMGYIEFAALCGHLKRS